jgi:HD-GYP domain-containing protein (c-di-GMP phosphodiesterase class II)
MPPEAAFAELYNEAGIRLDKSCVEALRKAYDNGKLNITDNRNFY